MLRAVAAAGSVLVGVTLATPALALCSVEDGVKTLAECLNDAASGEEILLPANARVEFPGGYTLRRDVKIRSVSPDWPATIVHSDPGEVPTTEAPLPNGQVFLVPKGLTLELTDVEFELATDGTYQTSRKWRLRGPTTHTAL